jgi:hypothetical protein
MTAKSIALLLSPIALILIGADQAVRHLGLQHHNGNNDRVVRRIRQHTAGFRRSTGGCFHALRSIGPPAF